MPEFSIGEDSKRRVSKIVEFVSYFMRDLPAEGRFALAIELLRLMSPEIEELKRKTQPVTTVDVKDGIFEKLG